MGVAAKISLPNGYWVDGAHHRWARVRPLAGVDEEFLLESRDLLLPAERTTALLSRCVTQLDGLETVSADAVRGLTVGDREALLLHVRRLTAGERLQCTLTCPAPACSERMDVELRVSDLLQPPEEAPQSWHEARIERGEETVHVRFRLPTGLDQEMAARAAVDDPRSGLALLLQRCVEGLSDREAKESAYLDLLLDELSPRMAALDPSAELVLDLACPECGHEFSSVLDAGSYICSEIATDPDELYRQVHLLALHYHWSESEILSMSTTKRRRYLELLLTAPQEEGRA